jgi:chromosome segregation ATPase
MSTINLATFRELLKTELPRLLRENPQARHEIWGLMLESFPSRQEFTALLEELRTFREDSNRRFEQQAAELRDFRAEMYTFREDTHQRFEAIDHRFDTVDQRFDAVDRRFDAVDQRFDTVDRRFDAVDQRFEVVDRRFNSLESRMEAGFQELRQAIDRLGSGCC